MSGIDEKYIIPAPATLWKDLSGPSWSIQHAARKRLGVVFQGTSQETSLESIPMISYDTHVMLPLVI